MDTQTLKEILLDQQEELKDNDLTTLISRYEEPRLHLDSRLAQVVIGVRRSGKSILCYKVLQQSGVNYAYVNYDDERLTTLTTEDLNTVLDVLYRIYGDFNHLFLDEIQNIEGWPLFVNRLLRKGMHVFLTGSNAKLLSNDLVTHLTGRHHKVELYPFSFADYCKMKNVDTQSLTTKAKALRIKALEEYLQGGGFPELFYETDKREYIQGLLDSIIRKDIARRFKLRHVEVLRRMATYLSDHYCQEFVASKVASLFGISDHTAENYYSYLKQAFLLIGVNRFSFKSAERVLNEKVYVVDTAFATDKEGTLATENLGWRLENVVLVELLRRTKPEFADVFYYKNRESQVDFVVAKDGKVQELVQVSYDISHPKTERREVKGLKDASKAFGCNRMTLITLDSEKTISTENGTIQVVSAANWLIGSQR
jgi:predicted AAA+ superfamily ATPase